MRPQHVTEYLTAIASSDRGGVATARKLAAMCDGGDLDEEGEFIIPPEWDTIENPGLPFAVFDGVTTDGALRFEFEPSTYSGILTVRGVEVLRAGVNVQAACNWGPLDKLKWRAWYRPSIGECGFATRVNGAWNPVYRGVASGAPLARPTAAWIGSVGGLTKVFPGHHARWRSRGLDDVFTDPSVPIYLCGDSIYANFIMDQSVASLLAQGTARAMTDLCATQAVGGDTCAQQTARLATATVNAAAVRAVITETGVNNILASGQTAAFALGQKAIEVAAIRAKFPGLVRLYAQAIAPCHKRAIDLYTLTPANYPDYASGDELYEGTLDFNAGLAAIPGVDVVITGHLAPLSSVAAGYLDAAHDRYGDGLHPERTGRQILAYVDSSALTTHGDMPP